MTTKTKCFIACAYQFGDQYKDDAAIYTQVNIHKGQIIQSGIFLGYPTL